MKPKANHRNRTLPVVPTESKFKNVEPKRTSPLLAYCKCGKKLLVTTKKDIYDGVQPLCEKC
jgi:hypothetical protein